MGTNKKKKKAASNPARGFATVSLPSKSKETQDVERETLPANPSEPRLVTNSKKANQLIASDKLQPVQEGTSSIQEMSPEDLEAHLEDADLQNIIDTHAARCKADAVRQVTRFESERRQLRSQSYRLATASWLHEETVEDILTRSSEMRPVLISRINIDEPNILVRLWTLRRVLTALRFSSIDSVIQHVILSALQDKIGTLQDVIWGLHEALEWYAIHGNSDDLPDYESGVVYNLAQAAEASEPDMVPETQIDTKDKSKLTDTLPEIQGEEEESDITPLPSSGSDDEDPSTFVDSYVRSKTLLFDLEQKTNHFGKKSKRNTHRLRLNNRIEKLKRDPLFDEYEADAQWKPRLRDLEIEAARTKKQQNSLLDTTKDWKTKKLQNAAEDDEDILGDMFSAEESQQEIDDTNTKEVRLIDFGRWSGVQPRKLMEENCRSLDAKCRITFATLSATSYSTRQSVNLIWSSSHEIKQNAIQALPSGIVCNTTSRVLRIEMLAVAASTPAQAESYLSTLVMFLASNSTMGDQKQLNRLPSVWKTLYQDLQEDLKRITEAEDKATLRELRRLIQEISDTHGNIHPSKQASRDQSQVAIHTVRQNTRSKFSEAEARERWISKTSAPGYRSILNVREQLPVYLYKEQILQTIHENQLVVVCADTGAGKSTQVPSFVLEHELSNGRDCRILVTQPRRISAISLARRVSQELGEGRNDLGTDRSLVGYAIRLESKTSSSTRITFATTGVLLRMIESTPDLEDIECLILDEVHERTMDLDLLFISLRKLQERRSSLKIILMSATVDAEKFSRYFNGAPIMNVPGRTFPVEVKYLEDAVEDTLDIRSAKTRSFDDDDVTSDEAEHSKTSFANLDDYSSKTKLILSQMDEYRIDYDLVADLAAAIATKEKYIPYSKAILVFMPGIAEIRKLQSVLLSRSIFMHNWIIHLLHSSFSTDDLERAFAAPPPGQRKIVIATNIAETGITIPDVTTVIDTCKEKIMRFDERRQLSKLIEGFISRSSARQRKGRAARVQEGLCFHLVTKHRYENVMLEQHVPEMLRLSLQDPILRIKVWNLGSIEETLSAAIDPPTHKNIYRAIEKLKDAGALDSSENLTPLGKQLARLPLEVVLGKLAIFGIVFKCLDSVITIVAALTSKSPFLSDRGQNNARLPFSRSESDLISTLNAYQGWRKARDAGIVHQYCRKHQLSDQNLTSIEDQKIQLLVYLVDAGLLSLEAHERIALNKSRSSGHRKSLFDVPERYKVYEHDHMLSAVIAMAFYPRILVREGKGWRNVYTNQHVNLTASSVNRVVDKPPKWLCFYEAMQTKTGTLNVLETSKIPEAVIVILMGEAEFNYFSGVIVVDNGKMRFCLRRWRQLAAVKAMRECLAQVMHRCWQTPGLAATASGAAWVEAFATIVAGSNTKSR